jgi:hypothetical protein
VAAPFELQQPPVHQDRGPSFCGKAGELRAGAVLLPGRQLNRLWPSLQGELPDDYKLALLVEQIW